MKNGGRGTAVCPISQFLSKHALAIYADHRVAAQLDFLSGDPAFLDIHQVKKRHQVRPLRQSSLLATANQTGRAAVPPASLHHEGIPDFDLLLIGPTARFKTPIEDFLIAATLQRAGGERLELHLQKSTDPVIEGPVSRNKSQMVALWKLALGVQANFIKDPTEEDDAADGISGAAEWEGHGKESG